MQMQMPSFCPGEGCFDKFPMNPSKSMRRMVYHYRKMLEKVRNPMAAPVHRQAIIICYELKSELKKEQYLAQNKKKWPYPIDFQNLSKRVLLMKSDLDRLIKDEKKRADTIVFRHLINAIGAQTAEAGLKAISTARIPPGAIMKMSRPG